MNKLLVFLCTIAVVFFTVGIASAVPIVDPWDPSDVFLKHDGTEGGVMQYDWTFDLTDDNFNPSCQDVTTAVVSVSLYDDEEDPVETPNEYARLYVGGPDAFGDWVEEFGLGKLDDPTNRSFTLSGTNLDTLSDQGTLNVRLVATGGDFFFDSARLEVEATECPESPVPEPASMLLMGTGLIGLAGLLGRKKLRKTLMK